jgi:hypothetical protein
LSLVIRFKAVVQIEIDTRTKLKNKHVMYIRPIRVVPLEFGVVLHIHQKSLAYPFTSSK